ncbi:MAG: RNA polymerase sigma factor [Candidatus Paceibacterota bacterium]
MNRKEENFIRACEVHADPLFRYSLFKVSDRDLAKDLVQETFLRAWNHVAEGKEIDNFKAFFYRVLGNMIIDEYRKKKTISLESMTEDGFDIRVDEEGKIADQIDGAIALRVLGKIPEKYREVMFMKYVQDFSNKEIAELLDESENSISVKIHRGIKKIKEIFNEE